MDWLWESLRQALLMAWQTGWALVLGFAVSAALQTFVARERMAHYFGRADFRAMALATGFGAASSSCSYAAAAAGRSAFSRGAALVPTLAFMFASTNLVFELFAVLWLLMGWRFVAAELIGAFVLIGLLWLLARLFLPRDLESQARRAVDESDAGAHEGGCCNHEHGEHHHDNGPTGKWSALAGAFVMDWQMLWKEIAIGFLIAGFLGAVVPMTWWRTLFIVDGPGWLALLENALVGPLIAMASFVCSVGNLPLANVLWTGGIRFGGVISFIYADLLIIPLILIYRKSFGTRAAWYIVGVFYLSMVGAGLIVDLLFGALGWLPQPPANHAGHLAMHAGFSWNYTTWLDLAALLVAGILFALHERSSAASEHQNPAHSTPAAD